MFNKNRIEEKIYENIAKKLIEESNKQQQKIAEQLTKRLEGWEDMIKVTITKYIDEIMEKKGLKK